MDKKCISCKYWIINKDFDKYGFCSNEVNPFKTTYYTQTCRDYKKSIKKKNA